MGSNTGPYHLPVVSYADLEHNNPENRDKTAGEFTQALRDYGACRIRDHGIPQKGIDKCFERCRAFFERDASEKIADAERARSSPVGIKMARFVPYGAEKTRGEPHLEEVLQLRDAIFDVAADAALSMSPEAQDLIDSARDLHKACGSIHRPLLECLESSLSLSPSSLTGVHSRENSFFAPTYFAPCSREQELLRVPAHIDPTTLLFNFPDSHGGLKVADLRGISGTEKISATEVQHTAPFIDAGCQTGEFVVVAGNLLRKLLGDAGIKHAVHYVERPLGSSGFHLSYWTVPDMQTRVQFGGRCETVEEYLARVFPSTFKQGYS
ncbi:uncharacterized protein DSM5745_09629 [Aspergillus mulundensis]|uniref:Non-haem dioxygenase N-terminal domain-containing protein n=1 Tax=Aspergillus mulundensis TaxID=1810919 RepID=A0A3D8QW37_9EURO|nr:hypothetical protein DSM5745_09629 [Aspergillus mulundensis]RDW65890.1 hypothetical protein DSM5745_09629 [Aspergillus mulundensis]